MISCEKSYIVYLDDEYTVQWTWNVAYGDDPPGFAEVANRIGHLETLSATQLSGKQNELFERLLAEGMARILGEKDERKATEALNNAEAYLSARGAENARTWYLTGSSIVAFLSTIIACLLWLLKEPLMPIVSSGTIEVLLGACLGGPGALLSILYRSEKIPMEATAGPKIHYIEGAARALAGNFGAFVMALAVKANLVLGIIRSGDYNLPALLVVCFVAGTSERLVRGFIGRMETSAAKA